MSSERAIKIGITGGISAGKSFISEMIEKIGYPVFYSDEEAKKIITSDEEVKDQIIELLGEKAYVSGSYNVVYVSKIVFNDSIKLEKLNKIVHPAVRKAFENWAVIQFRKGNDLVFNEAALLIESGTYKEMDQMVLVSAPMDIRIQRLMKRNNLTEADALLKINAQTDDEFKRQFVNYEIINDGRAVLSQLLNVMNSIRP